MVKFHEICSWSTASFGIRLTFSFSRKASNLKAKMRSVKLWTDIMEHPRTCREAPQSMDWRKCRRKPYGWFFCGTSWTIFRLFSWILRSQNSVLPWAMQGNSMAATLLGSFNPFEHIIIILRYPPSSSHHVTEVQSQAILLMFLLGRGWRYKAVTHVQTEGNHLYQARKAPPKTWSIFFIIFASTDKTQT